MVENKISSSENDINRLTYCKNIMWDRWADSALVTALHLIDCSEKKKQKRDSIPWSYTGFSDADLFLYCRENIYATYTHFILDKIRLCDDQRVLSALIHKLIHVSNLYDILSSPNRAQDIYYQVLHCLFEKKCEDASLLVTMWTSMCCSSEARKAVFAKLLLNGRTRNSAQILTYILKMAHSARFDFWGIWLSSKKRPEFSFCPVTLAILQGKIDQLTTLLKYGFKQNSLRTAIYDEYFMAGINYTYCWLKHPLLKPRRRRSILTETLLFMVAIVNCRSYQKKAAIIQSLHLLWNSLPYPFPTKAELEDEVYRRFLRPPPYSRMSAFPNSQIGFLSLCGFYERAVFPNDSQALAPRRLQHLSKCAVRKSLQACWQLPDGVTELPIPKVIQSYIAGV